MPPNQGSANPEMEGLPERGRLFDGRLSRAIQWIVQTQAAASHGKSGWGWFPDVEPNPQNTAEVVCTLAGAGKEIPEKEAVLKMLVEDHLRGQGGGTWEFESVLDISWRLRAFSCGAFTEPEIVRYREKLVSALLASQINDTGAWTMVPDRGPASVTATCAAVTALHNTNDKVHAETIRRAIRWLANESKEATQLYEASLISLVMSLERIKSLGSSEVAKARKRCLKIVFKFLSEGSTPVEEERLVRGGKTDTWRHITNSLALRAVIEAEPDEIYAPAFRRCLIELIELQEADSSNINFGGFRSSPEGFVVSYSTTQAVDVLVSLDKVVGSQGNPGKAWDHLVSTSGLHHSDPHVVGKLGNFDIVMNSHAALSWLLASAAGACSVLLLALFAVNSHGATADYLLAILAVTMVSIGGYVYAAARLPSTSNRRVAAVIFTCFTAVFLPLIVLVKF